MPGPVRPPIQRIAALVIDFRTQEGAEKLTLSLARLNSEARGFEVISCHVDNGNEDVRALSKAQAQAGVRLIRVPRNDGYASGIQAAIDQLRASGADSYDAFWLLNSDLEVEPDCLEKLVAVLDREPKAAAVGPVVYADRERKRVWGARGVVSPLLGVTAMVPWESTKPLPRWSYIPGSSLLIRASALDEVGGMPLRYRMYFEETHLCVQLQKRGWELYVEPGAAAYHFSESMKGRIPARHFAYYFARNNLYFWKENFGIPSFLQLPRAFFVATKELALPLRRAPDARTALERLGLIGAGLIDSFFFLREKHTPFERRLFPDSIEQDSSDPAVATQGDKK